MTNRKLRARKLISLSQLCSSRCLVVGFVMKGASNQPAERQAKQVKWTDLHAPCRGWECSSDPRIQTAVSKAIHNHGSRQQATKAPPGLSPTTLRRLRGETYPLVSRTRQWHRGKPRTAEAGWTRSSLSLNESLSYMPIITRLWRIFEPQNCRYFILNFNCSNLILMEALNFRNPDSRAGNRQIIRKGRDIKP